MIPNDHEADAMIDVGDFHRRRKVPLTLITTPVFFAVRGGNHGSQFRRIDELAFPLQLAVHFQVAEVTARTPARI